MEWGTGSPWTVQPPQVRNTSGLAAGVITRAAVKSWVRAPSPRLWDPVTAGQGLRITAGISSVAETSPQNLFAMLKPASTVDRRGSAPGPGWTGTSYAFSVRITFGPAGSDLLAVTATGTVDVDQQGRVRSLDAAYTLPAQASAPAKRVTAEMTFSDFGTPVSVSAPPASEVLTPANIQIQSGPTRRHAAAAGEG
jgi:hypothetical protein